MSLKDVCCKLDEKLLEFIETLDAIYLMKAELETVMKNGYFNMAKARYSMGAKAVTSLQYNLNEDEDALLHIDVDTSDNYNAFHITQSPSPSSDTSNLRQRTKRSDTIDGFTDLSNAVEDLKLESDDAKDENAEPLKTKKKKDPLKWFGLLVPQNLRQSQGQFKQAIEISVDLANLQQKYVKLRGEYRELNRRKRDLVAEISPDMEEYELVSGQSVQEVTVKEDTD